MSSLIVLSYAGFVVCDLNWYGVSGLWSWTKCEAWRFSLLEILGVGWLFENFCWPFIATFGIESAPKNLGWKVHDWLEKKALFNCKFIFTFQPDGCAKPTCAVTFYSFWSKPSSRQYPFNVTFFQLKRTLMVFLLVCLFIHFAGEWVWNVFVNQRRFLYITYIHRCSDHAVGILLGLVGWVLFKRINFYLKKPQSFHGK